MLRRIQRQRTKGWRMPPGAVYVGRPSKWGNPWSVGLVSCGCRSADCEHNSFRVETAEEAVALYRDWIINGRRRKHELHELRGKDLVCWCPLDQTCHADVLLELANAEEGHGG